jgi:hypothetical protein
VLAIVLIVSIRKYKSLGSEGDVNLIDRGEGDSITYHFQVVYSKDKLFTPVELSKLRKKAYEEERKAAEEKNRKKQEESNKRAEAAVRGF